MILVDNRVKLHIGLIIFISFLILQGENTRKFVHIAKKETFHTIYKIGKCLSFLFYSKNRNILCAKCSGVHICHVCVYVYI